MWFDLPMRALPLILVAVSIAAAAAAAFRATGPGARPTPPAARGALFEDATAAAGLRGEAGAHVSFADLDGDGAPDAIIDCTRVFLNVPSDRPPGRRFVRAGADSALARARRVACVQVGDVDGDGREDLFVGRMTDLSNARFQDDGLRNEILLGDGKGGFRPLALALGEARAETTISACFVDYDADGVLDLLVANGYVAYGKSLEAFPTRLFRGRGDGTFEDVTERAGMLLVAEPGRPESRRPAYGCTHTDWNNDGRQDLLVLSYGRQANRLWRNDGDGRFTDVGPETGFDGDEDRSGVYPAEAKARLGVEDEPPFRANGNTFDCAVADWDGDGDMDCFLAEITHWWAGASSDVSMLLENLGPAAGYRFRRRPDLVRRAHATPHWNQGDRHAGWLDVDNDGLLDLVVASSDYPDEQILRLYHQREDHTFEEWTDRLGFRWRNAAQISLGDFDRDGATDLLVATIDMRLPAEERARFDPSVGLFRNVAAAAAGNGFFSLRLRGAGRGRSNTDAVGARVTIVAGGRRQTREVYGGLGHAGHRDDAECRFGVGKARIVERVEVRWPDAAGTVQVFEDVPASRFYVLEEGRALREIP
jgi:hypothetical protein